MSYKIPYYHKSKMKNAMKVEGETIEHKMARVISNGEPITDGAPLIYTERKDGVNAAYNIRTDRWEIAADAMDVVHKTMIAKRDANANKKEAKVVEMKTKKDGGAESTNGTTGDK